jgi:hypothetical protein
MALAFVLAIVWGVVWAVCLQSRRGRFLAARFTWLAVVIGVGVDLLIGLLVVSFEAWWPLGAIVGLSSIGMIGRSLLNEHEDQQMLHLIVSTVDARHPSTTLRSAQDAGNGDKDTAAQ